MLAIEDPNDRRNEGMIILDRFEGEQAILEIHGKMKQVPRLQVAEGVQEGDVLKIINNQYVCDEEETIKRRKYIESLMKNLWEE
ncbi:MAG: DUF3006 domain-containing protein [Epulopiscium sp.]|nr:DUF3006 domain-containing protein [Candidatus Epulonipiscium sp.]